MKDCDIYHRSRVFVSLIIAIFSLLVCRNKDMPYCSLIIAFKLTCRVAIFSFEYRVQTTLHSLLIHQASLQSITKTRKYSQLILILIGSALRHLYLVCIFDSDDELTFALLCEEIIEERCSESSDMHESCWRGGVTNSYWKHLERSMENALCKFSSGDRCDHYYLFGY